MSKVHILPNLRKGLSNEIKEGYLDKDGLRAGFDVTAKLQGHKVGTDALSLPDLGQDGILNRSFYLAGPVDVQSIDPAAIYQTVPSDKSQGFSKDYMPFVEFFEEDFPWRYTPLPSSEKLPPWLMLLACVEGEYTVLSDEHGRKRVEIHLDGMSDEDRAAFYPERDKFHRLAHVQITTPGDENPIDYVKDHPDDGISRLFCCRRLQPFTTYTVFLVPAFELGRLAGLGEPLSGSVGLNTFSWVGQPSNTVFPVYYQWSFTSGSSSFIHYAQKQAFLTDKEFSGLSSGLKADISETGLREYRKLEPLVNDAEPIDIPMALVKKGFAEKDLSSEDPRMDEELKVLLQKSPVFSDDVTDMSVDEDPWVVPPVYGARHVLAKPEDLDTEKDHPFLKDLNLKFRNRAAAGLGANVVKKNQEMFMNRAWGMVEEVNRLNQRIREFYEAYKANDASDEKISSLREYKFQPHVSGLQADTAIRVAHAQSAARINPLDMATDVTGKNLHVMMTSMGDYERTAGIRLDELNALARPEFWDMEAILKRSDLYRRLTTQEGFFSKVDRKYSFLDEIVNVIPPTVKFKRLQRGVQSEIQSSNGRDVFCFTLKRGYVGSISNYIGFMRSEEVLRWMDDTSIFMYANGREPYFQSLVRLMEGAKANYKVNFGEEAEDSEGGIDQIMLPIQSDLRRKDSSGSYRDYLFIMKDGAYNRRFKDDPGIRIPLRSGGRIYILPEKKIYDGTLNGYMSRAYKSGEVYGGVSIGYGGVLRRKETYRFYALKEKELKNLPWWDGTVRIYRTKSVFTTGNRVSFLCLAASQLPNSGEVKLLCIKMPDQPTLYTKTVKGKDGSDEFLLQYLDTGGGILELSGKVPDCEEWIHIRFDRDDNLFRKDDQDHVIVDYATMSNYLCRARTCFSWFRDIVWIPNMISVFMDSTPRVSGRPRSYWPDHYPAFLESCRELTADAISNIGVPAQVSATLDGLADSITKQIVLLAEHEELKKIREKMTQAKTERDKVESADETWKESHVDADEVNRKRLVEIAKTFADRGMTLDLKESNFDGKYPVMAAPVFPDPTSFYLREISERFLLPSVDELKMNSICCFQTNPAFEEAFLAGMNTEMGRELLWREYPTDERGSCFRKFWDQDELPQDFGKGYFDVQYMHNWKGRLGENHEPDKGRILVFVIKSELMGNYPDTSVRLAKAVTKDGNTILQPVLSPVMTGWLADDTFMAGFQVEKLPTTQGIFLTFIETDKSQRFKNIYRLAASDNLSSEFAVNRVDIGSVWGVEIQSDYLKS